MKKILNYSMDELQKQHFDSLAVGRIDFTKERFEHFTLFQNQLTDQKVYFDIASLTKPLSLASCYLKFPEIFNPDMELLLNHRGGLPAWGRLDKKTWKKQIQNYEINRSEKDLYSDFSALRLMLEIENKMGKSLYGMCEGSFDDECLSWLDLLEKEKLSPITGHRNGHSICGEVHDDNAFFIREKLSHAGLFSTINGLCKTLLEFNENNSLFNHMNLQYDKLDCERRFIAGWDRVTDPAHSLAGVNASLKTFGHLGFTGCSIWIDLEKGRGAVILSNATKSYWYDRSGLEMIRKAIGQFLFG